jgi:CubicO group peptidase (beta-lactamase class C family)
MAANKDVDGIVEAAVQRAIKEHGELGVQVAAYLNGKLIVDVWGGVADEASGRPVQADTLFNFFSVTKAFTAVALHIQAQRGLIDYAAPVSRYWPEFAARGKAKATVQDALLHRTCIPQMPAESTPEMMCDWDRMVRAIADLEPLYEPGSKSTYHAYSFGWIVGELVRRTDAKRRSFAQFVYEEICAPLKIDNFWLGIPDEVEARVATLKNERAPAAGGQGRPQSEPERVAALAIPHAVRTGPEVFGRADVRRACLPGMGIIACARSVARFWAMLANGGELDGVRILEEQRVRGFCSQRPRLAGDQYDVKRIGMGGLSLGVAEGETGYMLAAGKGDALIGHGGSGGQLGWADLDARLGVAFCHNRLIPLSRPGVPDPLVIVNAAVRTAAGKLMRK